MIRRLVTAASLLAMIPAGAQADESCAANFLSGNAKGVIDAETGQPIAILPYAPVGYIGSGAEYTINLGGNSYGPAKPLDPPLPPPLPPQPPRPPQGGFSADLMLQPNALGATRIVFREDGTARLTGPGIDFTFQGVDQSALAFDGPVVALSGQGVINNESLVAVPLPSQPRNAVLTLSSGFNPTGTRTLLVAFSNGVTLNATIGANAPPAPPPPTGFTSDLTLQSNALGAMRLVFPGDGTGRLTGPGTDFTFTQVDASALAVDGNLVARGGSGTINGEATTAVPVFGGGSDAVLSVTSGFGPGPRGVVAQFANGARLEAFVQPL